MPYAILATFLSFFALLPVYTTATCYFPDGSIQSSDIYQPCKSGSNADGFRMCCGTNRDLAGNVPNDTCRPDGLCDYISVSNGVNQTWRESCTDPTWDSPNCIKFCLDGINEKFNSRSKDDAEVTPCGDGTYCCGAEQTDCCSRHEGIYLVNGTPTPTLSSSARPTLTGASAIGGTADTSTHKQSSDTGQKVGVGVGVGIGVAVIIAGILVGIWLRRRERGIATKAAHEETEQNVGKTTFIAEADGKVLQPELEDERKVWGGEIDGTAIMQAGTHPSKRGMESE